MNIEVREERGQKITSFILPALSSFLNQLCWYGITATKEVVSHEKFQAVSKGAE